MARLLPVLLLLVGLAVGLGAGLLLRPPAPEVASAADGSPAAPVAARAPQDFVRLNNQFVVPVLEQEQVRALVILGLSIEIAAGNTERVYSHEPKLRDAFLQVMFEHANAGGFSGAFTRSANMAALRSALREAATGVLGPDVSDVLIVDMVRQDN